MCVHTIFNFLRWLLNTPMSTTMEESSDRLIHHTTYKATNHDLPVYSYQPSTSCNLGNKIDDIDYVSGFPANVGMNNIPPTHSERFAYNQIQYTEERAHGELFLFYTRPTTHVLASTFTIHGTYRCGGTNGSTSGERLEAK